MILGFVVRLIGNSDAGVALLSRDENTHPSITERHEPRSPGLRWHGHDPGLPPYAAGAQSYRAGGRGIRGAFRWRRGDVAATHASGCTQPSALLPGGQVTDADLSAVGRP